eukprot:COSAG01_NODE_65230_length_274_cov_0.554286_2_plen_50_part_01
MWGEAVRGGTQGPPADPKLEEVGCAAVVNLARKLPANPAAIASAGGRGGG